MRHSFTIDSFLTDTFSRLDSLFRGDPTEYGSIETKATYTNEGSRSSSSDFSEGFSEEHKTADGSGGELERFLVADAAVASSAGAAVHLRSSQSYEDGVLSNICSPIKTLHEITIIHVADENGHLAHYPDEEKDQRHREAFLVQEEKKKSFFSILGSAVESLKSLYSIGLLVFSIVIVTAAIFSRQTVATAGMGVPTPIAFIIFWLLIFWLALMEGGQGCLVGLQPIDKALYTDSHPRSFMNTSLAHKGDNMERFIVGRQFLVVLVVFVTNLMASSVKGASVLGLNDTLTESFLGSGVAVTLIAIMIGQSAQINAANCMLDFLDNYYILITTYLSLILDMSGLLHSVYLVQIVFSKMTNTPIETTEPPRNGIQNISFWARICFSCVALGFSFAATLSAIFNGQTTMYAGVPEVASIILLLILLCFVGMMEGMQIALFAVVNLPAEEMEKYPIAAKSCKLTFSGSNLQAFLIGRQMCVTFCMFFIARITSCNVIAGENTIFGVNDDIQKFFNTGSLGAVITTVVGSLAWRIIASSFPVAFLSNPLIYAIINLCLFVEVSGVCSVAWVLAIFHKQVVGFQLDEVYIGTSEERAATKKMEDDNELEFF